MPDLLITALIVIAVLCCVSLLIRRPWDKSTLRDGEKTVDLVGPRSR